MENVQCDIYMYCNGRFSVQGEGRLCACTYHFSSLTVIFVIY